MNAKVRRNLICVAFATVAYLIWILIARKWAAPYQETNAVWAIHGICRDAETGEAIGGAKISAMFREPIAFKHHWRNPPPLRITEVTVVTATNGLFELTGNGGSAYVRARQPADYREPEPWENWRGSARNGLAQIRTNISLSLKRRTK
jgi:hypothetical protein